MLSVLRISQQADAAGFGRIRRSSITPEDGSFRPKRNDNFKPTHFNVNETGDGGGVKVNPELTEEQDRALQKVVDIYYETVKTNDPDKTTAEKVSDAYLDFGFSFEGMEDDLIKRIEKSAQKDGEAGLIVVENYQLVIQMHRLERQLQLLIPVITQLDIDPAFELYSTALQKHLDSPDKNFNALEQARTALVKTYKESGIVEGPEEAFNNIADKLTPIYYSNQDKEELLVKELEALALALNET